MDLKPRLEVLKRNKWRYIAMVIGFFLLVAPFAFLTQAIFLAIGNTSTATIHSFCIRSPFDQFTNAVVSGNFAVIAISVSAWLVLVVLIVAVFAGPLFCGYMCPVGSVSEAVSRLTPLPNKWRIRIKNTKVTRSIRFGFLAGFLAVALIVGQKMSTDVASICCRYCSSSTVQNFSNALITGNTSVIGYWSSATLIVLISYLIIGGIFFVGGRGWCLFFCPLGAVSGIAHAGGAKAGLYKTRHIGSNCQSCKKCTVNCPMQAIGTDREVEQTLCIGCHECVNNCNFDAYEYKRGKDPKKPEGGEDGAS
jgi:ferredoxin-type protein NapH